MKKIAVSLHAVDNFTPDVIKGLEGLDYIHVDVMDGKFVEVKKDNLTIFRLLKQSYEIPIIAHFMVEKPLPYLKQIRNDIDYFVFHVESRGHIEKIIHKIKKYNLKVGLALNPETNLSKIYDYLNRTDIVLIMAVNPGKSGQSFMWDMLDKVNLLLAYRSQNNLRFLIDIDGGINVENAKHINADILTSASTILNAEKPNLVIKHLKEN